ncbi:MAG: serine protease [Acidobacteriota bacterium]
MSFRRPTLLPLFVGLLALLGFGSSALAQPAATPSPDEVWTSALAADGESSVLLLPAVNPAEQRLRDEQRVKSGGVPHFAAVHEVEVDPWNHGTWRPASRQRAAWQLDVHSPGALSLSFAFSRFQLPRGATLLVRSADETAGPFTAADHDEHGQLWTPPMSGDRLRLELEIPLSAWGDIELQLARVHHGYVGFGEPALEKAGSCHLEPACGEDASWTHEARSVALLSIEGVRYCTGFLVNNTAEDARPYLITARHCGVHRRNAASVVAMWRHEKAVCGELQAAALAPSTHFQSGAILRASRLDADIALLELDDPVAVPGDGAVFAGWDRAEDRPREGVVIHHPNTGHQRIAFADGPLLATRHLQAVEMPGGDHLRVGSWRLGTTEGGSSGAPLFNEDRRVVGVLHGGYAACGNRDADWFGRLAAVWHGGSPASRLRDWLDPLDLQPLVLDALSVGEKEPGASD